jgi:hypothetical protein
MFSPAAAGKPRVSPSLATAVSSRHLASQGGRPKYLYKAFLENKTTFEIVCSRW